ncbi:MAG: DUF3021 domain-containing protein [Clostridiales bacterium]|nr:DUF3021 domain-containing protein [Clostridiales bacterium]
MKKRLITRLISGFAVGVLLVHLITFLVNYLGSGQCVVCMPELSERLGSVQAVVVQTLLGAILGMIAFAGTLFFDIEEWSLLRATAAHCALILSTFLIVGARLHWFSMHIIAISIMAGIIILMYALIWVIMYLIWKREIREMNRLTEEYKKYAYMSESDIED